MYRCIMIDKIPQGGLGILQRIYFEIITIDQIEGTKILKKKKKKVWWKRNWNKTKRNETVSGEKAVKQLITKFGDV